MYFIVIYLLGGLWYFVVQVQIQLMVSQVFVDWLVFDQLCSYVIYSLLMVMLFYCYYIQVGFLIIDQIQMFDGIVLDGYCLVVDGFELQLLLVSCQFLIIDCYIVRQSSVVLIMFVGWLMYVQKFVCLFI